MPNYLNFSLTFDDQSAVNDASVGGFIDWNSEHLAGIKKRVKDLHIEIQTQACCYCRRSFVGEFRMVIDIEHVLPKREFPELIFSPVNLSVACKRCNMNVKGERWSFVLGRGRDEVLGHVDQSASYQIIHPNLDAYSEHLGHISIVVNGFQFRKFLKGSATRKGAFTYDFFDLQAVETGSLDVAQGLPSTDDLAAERLVAHLELLMGIRK